MSNWLEGEAYRKLRNETFTIVFKAREDRKELNFNRRRKKMFEEIYKEAFEKLNNDIRRLVSKLMLDNGKKSRDYRDGLTAACEAFLQLASESSGDLIIALDREAEKEAAYYGSVYEKQ